MKEIHSVNYANTKHHRQQLREQIDPKVIEKIEVDYNPSQNYRNAFKAVYYDELEKTVKFQEEKKLRERENQQLSPCNRSEPAISRNISMPTLHLSMLPLQNMTNNGVQPAERVAGKNSFIDYDQERKRRFERHIQAGLDGGQSFFRAQDQYQRRKQEESRLMKNGLIQQLQLKQYQKEKDHQTHQHQIEVLKENRRRQVEYEQELAERQRLQHLRLGQQIKYQAENQRIKRHRKSYFQMNCVNKHNPITNPIQYHIDNPYILQKYTTKAHNSSQEYQQNGAKNQEEGHYWQK